MGEGSEIVAIPGVSELGPWVLIAVLLFPKMWDGVLSLLGKKAESESVKATAEVSVEIERIKADFERQKDFQDDLIAECQRLRDTCKQLADHNHLLSGSVMERDAIIRDRDRTIADMQRQLNEMKIELERLKRHVETIEDDRARLKASCEVNGPHE